MIIKNMNGKEVVIKMVVKRWCQHSCGQDARETPEDTG